MTYNVSQSSNNTLITATNYGNLKFINILFVTDKTNNHTLEFLISDHASVQFIDCIFTQIILKIDIINNGTILLTNCSIIDIQQTNNQNHSIFSVINSNLIVTNSIFTGNKYFFSLINSIQQSNIQITDCIFNKNVNNKYIWYSRNVYAELTNTQINNSNNCGINHCFSFIDSDLWIDSLSASNMSTQFGHDIDNNNNNTYNELFAIDFNPETVLKNIDFVHFGSGDDAIIFTPCIEFNPEQIIQTDFENISSSLNATHVYNSTGSFYKDALNCNDTALCFIQCILETFSCFGSYFTINGT
eukprot:79639_1